MTTDERELRRLIARSSLGTRTARAARNSVPEATGQRVVEAASAARLQARPESFQG